jgi:hypothetical protein
VIQKGVKDRVKVTVIAADFGGPPEEEEKRRTPTRRERIKVGENLDVPTFLRRSRDAREEEAARD